MIVPISEGLLKRGLSKRRQIRKHTNQLQEKSNSNMEEDKFLKVVCDKHDVAGSFLKRNCVPYMLHTPQYSTVLSFLFVTSLHADSYLDL
jgi:hypothetical protein